MSGQPVCPECSTQVGVDWEWCHNCGFDPEGKRAAAEAEAAALIGPVAPATGFPGARDADLDLDPMELDPIGLDPLGYDPLGYDDVALEPVGRDAGPSDPGRNGDTFGLLSSSSLSSGPGAPASFPSSAPASPSGGFSASGPSLLASAPPPPAAPPSSPPAPPASLPTAPPPSWNESFTSDDQGRRNGNGRTDAPLGHFNGGTDAPAGAGTLRWTSRIDLRKPLMIGGAVLVVVLIGYFFVNLAGGDRPKPSFNNPSSDPNAPPPIGAVPLNTASTVAPPSTVPGWSQYRSPDGTFHVSFPAAPTTDSAFVDVGGRSTPALVARYTTGPDGATYELQYLELPTGVSFADSQAGFDEVSAGQELRQGDSFDVGGVAGVLFDGPTRDGRGGTGLLVVKATRLYILTAVGVDAVQLDTFFRSFKILRDPGT